MAQDSNLPISHNDLALPFFVGMTRHHTHTVRDFIVLLVCTLLAVVICSLNAMCGASFSFELFYLFPVILAVWWGKFPLGAFVALEVTAFGVLARHQEWIRGGSELQFADEIIRFGFYILVCTLVCRFRRTISVERSRARTDSLTGAVNGRVFYEILNAEIDRFNARGEPFTLAYLDVDNFKKVNDQLGHAAGDQVLKVIVDTILKNTRRHGDTVARVGGDEFALILSETPTEKAHDVVEKLRQVLLSEMAQRNWPVTFSIGAINFCQIPGDVEVLIDKVDSLMYRVKRSGKNQLCFEVLSEEDDKTLATFERRASIRVACTRRIQINTFEKAGDGDQKSGAAKALDISATGLLFHAGNEFPKGSVILVQPHGPMAALLAKVVRTIKDTDGWLHGCQLAQLLSMEDLQKWLEPERAVSRRKVAYRH